MNKRQITGFTLIEMVIVAAIIGIFAAIALPSYQAYVLKSRRSQATATLLTMQLAEEKFRSNNNAYGDLTAVWNNVTNTEGGHYTLGITNLSATTYTLTATAVGGQANDAERGTNCSVLSVAVNGAATTKTPAACWED